MSPPRATVVITTRDRPDELRTAIASALAQSVDVEVLVVDDASADGVVATVAAEFPAVRVRRSEQPLGCVQQRNAAFGDARAPVVVSLDDDAFLSSPRTVEQTLAEFDDDRVGAVAIPLVDLREPATVRQRAPAGPAVAGGTFAAGATAFRVDAFRAVGGFAPFIGENSEEADFAMRLLDAGRVVRLGRADPVVHRPSAIRDVDARFRNLARNDLLCAWATVPLPHLPLRLAILTVKVLSIGVRRRRLRAVVRGVGAAAAVIARRGVARRPISRAAYVLARRLTRDPQPLEEVVRRLPPTSGP